MAMNTLKTLKIMFLSSILLLGFSGITQASDHGAGHGKKHAATADYMPSLITKTPLEGRMLAITIVRKTIGTIQKDRDTKFAVRKKYQDDPELLMNAAELVAMEFKTIAIANNYWR
jgi:hypothetical protein